MSVITKQSRLSAFLATLDAPEADDAANPGRLGKPVPEQRHSPFRRRMAQQIREARRMTRKDAPPPGAIRCAACKQYKPAAQFQPTARTADGTARTCDACAGVPALPWAEVAAAWAKGTTISELARRYGVARHWIRRAIQRERAWRIPPPKRVNVPAKCPPSGIKRGLRKHGLDEHAVVNAWRMRGVSAEALAAEMNSTKPTILAILRRHTSKEERQIAAVENRRRTFARRSAGVAA